MITKTFVASFLLLAATHVIDVHLHAPGEKSAAEMLATMRQLHVVSAVLIGTEFDLTKYAQWFDGAMPALLFPCESGKTPNGGAPCFANGEAFPDLAWLRKRIEEGKVRVLGEITAQYAGIAAGDPRMEPYFALAEELDVPVGIHMGIGPPGVAYPLKGFPPRKSPSYSGAAGDPLTLDPLLVRRPKLRIYVMHAAYPNLDHMLYMLYMHPQLYVDVSVLQWAIPRPEYYRYLKTLVDEASSGGSCRLRRGREASHRRRGRDRERAVSERSAEGSDPVRQCRAILQDP